MSAEKTGVGKLLLGTVLLAGLAGLPGAGAQEAQQNGNSKANLSSSVPASGVVKATAPAAKHSRYRPVSLSTRAIDHYQTIWGVDSFSVRAVESGQMVRFSYRVLDPQKAAALNDKKATPFMVDQGGRVKLVVPEMEKVGKLRQSSTPEAGKAYWMVFSNKGGFVKRGDRVTVEIGKFSVNGLTVE
jgi:hypothetical protein